MTRFFAQSCSKVQREPLCAKDYPAVRRIDLNRDDDVIFAELRSLLPEAQKFARTPVSRFPVGAAALGESGYAWLGANMEFPGLPLNFTVHAEQAAVTNARLHGEKRLLCLAVSAAPCGYCRQFLLELGTPLKILIGEKPTSLEELLPQGFRLETNGGGLLAQRELAPACLRGKSAAEPEIHAFPANADNNADLAEAARAAALRSYAPYTRSPGGVALRCASGKIFTGPLIESCAYNPTLTPLQTALIARNLAGAYDDPIVEAALVESKDPLVPQSEIFRAAMKILAPRAMII